MAADAANLILPGIPAENRAIGGASSTIADFGTLDECDKFAGGRVLKRALDGNASSAKALGHGALSKPLIAMAVELID